MIAGALLVVLAIAGLLGRYLYNLLHARRTFWIRRGTPYAAGCHLFFGNVAGIWRKEHSATVFQRIYKDFKRRRLPAGGFNFFFYPSVLVVDPEMVERVLVKDAHVFLERGWHLSPDDEPIIGSLFNQHGNGWRDAHATMTQLFDPKQLRRTFGTAAAVADELRVHIKQNVGRRELDIEDLMACFITHVIGTCVFGIRCGTIQHSKTEFREMCDRANQFSWIGLVRKWFATAVPTVTEKLLKVQTIDLVMEKFFMKLCETTVLHRKCFGVSREDLLQQLILMCKSGKWSTQKLASYCYCFVRFGMEICSSALVFSIYEMMLNPSIQNRLRDEINHALEDTDGQLSYDVIESMGYLEQVVKETFRKYPPVDYLVRQSKARHNHIPKGTRYVIPVYALHHDTDHFPQPERFDPERFGPHRSGKPEQHNFFSYIPFGAGPRGCIGHRFGLMLIKIGLVTLLRSFRFVPSPSNGDVSGDGPVRFKPNSLVLRPLKGSVRVRLEQLQ